LANPNIKAHIELRLSEIHMGADEALDRLGQMGRTDVSDFVDVKTDDQGLPDGWDVNLFEVKNGKIVVKKQTASVKKIKRKMTTDRFGNQNVEVEFELYDKQAALEKILRMHGKFGDVPTGRQTTAGALIAIPADGIAPSFFGSYRAVKSGLYDEFLEEGGRGSTKSSYVSEQIIELLVNNPTYHATAMRQYASTLRGSVFNQFIKSIELLGLTDKF